MELMIRAIDKIEEWMGHSPHPAVVVLPLGAFGVSNAADVLAAATGDGRYDEVARTSMAIGLLGTVAAAATGLRDYARIPKDRQPNHEIATIHGLGNATVGALYAASYILRDRRMRAGRPVGPTPRLLALAGGALAVYTGYLGGKLVSELGESVHPVMERWEGERGSEEYGRERLEPGSPLRPAL